MVILTPNVVNLTFKVVILTPNVVNLTFKVVILTPNVVILTFKVVILTPNVVILTSKMVTLTQIMLAGIKFRPEFYARVTDFQPGFGLSTRVSVSDVPLWRFQYVYFGLSARFQTFGQVSDFWLEFRFRLRFRISAKVSD